MGGGGYHCPLFILIIFHPTQTRAAPFLKNLLCMLGSLINSFGRKKKDSSFLTKDLETWHRMAVKFPLSPQSTKWCNQSGSPADQPGPQATSQSESASVDKASGGFRGPGSDPRPSSCLHRDTALTTSRSAGRVDTPESPSSWDLALPTYRLTPSLGPPGLQPETLGHSSVY